VSILGAYSAAFKKEAVTYWRCDASDVTILCACDIW
jgi:hypothetical protein